MSRSDLEWWGYLHTNGSRHLKRYFGPLDIEEANESPFCRIVVGPFTAANQHEAKTIRDQLLKENDNA